MNKLKLILFNTIRGFSIPVFNFLITLFGVSFFGKKYWGSIIDVLLWILLIVFISNWGNRDYLLKKYSNYPSKINNYFFINISSRCLFLNLTLLFFVFYPVKLATISTILVIIIYLYNSLDSLVIYHQKFNSQLIAEVVGFIIITLSIYFFSDASHETIIFIYCFAYLVKVIFLAIILKVFKKPITIKFSILELKNSFSYFLIGFNGWLQSRVTLFIVTIYLSKSQLSEYQLFLSAFLMLQAISFYLTSPFNKYIYRLPKKTINKLQKILYTIAIPIVAIGSFLIWIILEKIMNLSFESYYYLLGALMSLPTFFYTLDIIILMKKDKEDVIVKIIFSGTIISVLITLLLITKYETLGVIISICIIKWLILFLYKTQFKKLKN